MKLAELRILAPHLDTVELVPGADGYAVHGVYYDGQERLFHLLEGARGEPRSFASLDRAVACVRSAGYTGPIVINP